MTRVNPVYVTCPACGEEGIFNHYGSANVTLNPDLKQGILDDSLFTFTCEKCGESALVETDCLYHDMNQRLFYQLTPEADSDDQLKDVLRQLSESGLKLSFTSEGYRIRVVPTLSDLKEKIIISDAELDDRIIELLKIYIEATALEQIESEEITGVRFLSREENELMFAVFGDQDYFGEANIPIQAYEEEMLRRNLDDNGECYLIDREWALRKMGLRED